MNPGVCGILGIATVRERRIELDDVAIPTDALRTMARGPDGLDWCARGNVVLAHRRLVVIDPSPTGVQPMATADGRFAIVYNGELYNDAEVRRELGAAGVAFRGPSDSETVLRALEEWGTYALPHLRGMYALGLHDAATHTLLLARDPLGIKPLYYWLGQVDGASTLIFASEVQAILAHPDVRARPDLATVSAYLTTIRTT
jgi:asparagine synthase (glutamine-hydrolysing)